MPGPAGFLLLDHPAGIGFHQEHRIGLRGMDEERAGEREAEHRSGKTTTKTETKSTAGIAHGSRPGAGTGFRARQPISSRVSQNSSSPYSSFITRFRPAAKAAIGRRKASNGAMGTVLFATFLPHSG